MCLLFITFFFLCLFFLIIFRFALDVYTWWYFMKEINVYSFIWSRRLFRYVFGECGTWRRWRNLKNCNRQHASVFC